MTPFFFCFCFLVACRVQNRNRSPGSVRSRGRPSRSSNLGGDDDRRQLFSNSNNNNNGTSINGNSSNGARFGRPVKAVSFAGDDDYSTERLLTRDTLNNASLFTETPHAEAEATAAGQRGAVGPHATNGRHRSGELSPILPRVAPSLRGYGAAAGGGGSSNGGGVVAGMALPENGEGEVDVGNGMKGGGGGNGAGDTNSASPDEREEEEELPSFIVLDCSKVTNVRINVMYVFFFSCQGAMI